MYNYISLASNFSYSKLAVSYLDYVALCQCNETTDDGMKCSEEMEQLKEAFKSVDLPLSSNQCMLPW